MWSDKKLLEIDIAIMINIVSCFVNPSEEKSACSKVGCLQRVAANLIPNSYIELFKSF